VPPQNTDPFVWGEAIRYTFCRQKSNQKLRRLGRGTLVLFGARSKSGFELDTVMVVSEWIDDRREADLADFVDPAYRRWTIGPMYGWGEDERTYRLYYGATPVAPLNDMFSFVPCELAQNTAGFARPILSLDDLINPKLAQQARVVEISPDRIKTVWDEVVQHVTDQGLLLATSLELPREQ
jgi:hypothetical protein